MLPAAKVIPVSVGRTERVSAAAMPMWAGGGSV